MIRQLCAAALLACPMAANAITLDSFVGNTVVFGDSLSDAGVFGVQATDGDVWAAQLGLTFASGKNFAVGGARAITNPDRSDFEEQRLAFGAATPVLPDYSQAVIWFGGNDLLNLSGPGDIGLALGSIQAGVIELATVYGIDRFVLPGLPDFSRIPAAFGSADAQAASLGFNNGLQTLVAGLNLGGIDARYVDIAATFDAAFVDPAFPNPTGTCLRGAISCDGFLFWDPIHPTGAAHTRLAEAISAELAPVPLPASAPLLIGALALLAATRLRRSGHGPVAA